MTRVKIQTSVADRIQIAVIQVNADAGVLNLKLGNFAIEHARERNTDTESLQIGKSGHGARAAFGIEGAGIGPIENEIRDANAQHQA